MRRGFHRLLLVVLTGMPLAASPQSADAGTGLLRRFRREYPCRARHIEIRAIFLTRSDACVFTMVARHAVAVGSARQVGINPSDSSSIRRSRVAAFAFKPVKSRGRLPNAYWVVTLKFADSQKPIDVRIDQRTGSITTGFAEEL